MLILGGCGGKGSSSSAPAGGLTVAPGDGYVTVSWDMSSGAEYWLYHATTDGAAFDPNSCASVPGCGSNINVSSPYVVKNLVNGITYSFLLTSRTSGGPGGSPTPVVTAVPRIAGSSWTPNVSTDLNSLRGVVQNGTVFVAVGDNGVMFSSTVNSDGWATWSTWARIANPLPTPNNLYALTYGGNYLAAGAGGVILLSADAATWTAQASGTANDLYGLANNGSGLYVAVGANGTIIYSGGGNWSAASSPTSNALYGVAYGSGQFVAVGAQGAVLSSSDGVNWTAKNVGSNPQRDLRGIANAGSTFVAVSAAGTLITSTDGGASWNALAPLATSNTLNAVAFGRQFVAVGDGGTIFTSLDGGTWSPQASTPAIAENLYAVRSFTNSYPGIGYAAVGAAGRNLSAN